MFARACVLYTSNHAQSLVTCIYRAHLPELVRAGTCKAEKFVGFSSPGHVERQVSLARCLSFLVPEYELGHVRGGEIKFPVDTSMANSSFPEYTLRPYREFWNGAYDLLDGVTEFTFPLLNNAPEIRASMNDYFVGEFVKDEHSVVQTDGVEVGGSKSCTDIRYLLGRE